MTDLGTYYLRMASACELRAQAERLEAGAAAVDPEGENTRMERIECAYRNARSYEETARGYRRMAKELEVSSAA